MENIQIKWKRILLICFLEDELKEEILNNIIIPIILHSREGIFRYVERKENIVEDE